MEPDDAELAARMRKDFTRFYRLRVAATQARTASAAHELLTEAEDLASTWLRVPEWSSHWAYLDTTCRWWDERGYLIENVYETRIAGGPAIVGDSNATIDSANFELARQLDYDRRQAIAQHMLAEGPRMDVMPYEAIYAVHGQQETIRSAGTSWWQARQWLIGVAAATPAHAVDIEIRWRDLYSDVEHTIMTATRMSSAELHDQLTELNELLGDRPRVDGKLWIDDLHWEVLCDDYRDALVQQRNPWSFRQQLEHRLYADDLRDQLLDFGSRLGIGDAADQLAIIDHQVAEANLYALDPAVNTWLDAVTERAEQRLEQHRDTGVRLEYPHARNPDVTIHLGYDTVGRTNPWYANEHHCITQSDHTGWEIKPLGRYPTAQHLVHDLYLHVDPWNVWTYEARQQLPTHTLAALRDFDRDLSILTENLAHCRQIRNDVTARRPHELTTHRVHSSTAWDIDIGTPRQMDTERKIRRQPTQARKSSPATDAIRQQTSPRRERITRPPQRQQRRRQL